MLKNRDYVYAVYLNKSFSKAAQQLYISQPALSAAIKKVEEEIQLPLFDRSSSPIQLIPAGEYYIESIEKIMEIEKEMADSPRRVASFSLKISFPPVLSQKDRTKYLAVIKACPVHNSLRPDIKISVN